MYSPDHTPTSTGNIPSLHTYPPTRWWAGGCHFSYIPGGILMAGFLVAGKLIAGIYMADLTKDRHNISATFLQCQTQFSPFQLFIYFCFFKQIKQKSDL